MGSGTLSGAATASRTRGFAGSESPQQQLEAPAPNKGSSSAVGAAYCLQLHNLAN